MQHYRGDFTFALYDAIPCKLSTKCFKQSKSMEAFYDYYIDSINFNN